MGSDSSGFEEMLRAIARELSESVQRSMDELDLDEVAARLGELGVDTDRARDLVRGAGEWLRTQGEQHPGPVPERRAAPGGAPESFGTAAPHPLDLPTEEQGVALAALDSGRWSVEPGTDALTVHGHGPGPSDALGLVRELRVRDWLSSEGALTLTGRRALARWLERPAR